jgi:transketolase
LIDNPREGYGRALMELAAEDQKIVALDADLSRSTKGCLIEERYPDRHYELSIAEQNMVSVAVGLALVGKVPMVQSFGVFLTGRAYDQVRLGVAIGNTNVKLIGSSCGLSDFGDGASHQSLEDIALMRALPNMTIVVPADGREAYLATKAIAGIKGPAYLRLGRNDGEVVTREPFEIGRVYQLRAGDDAVIFTNGSLVEHALRAADVLETEDGIMVSVVNVPTVKPLDEEAILLHARRARAIVVAEEHSIYGGLCSAVAEVLARLGSMKMVSVAVKDCFGMSASSQEELLNHFGLDSIGIVEAVRSAEVR